MSVAQDQDRKLDSLMTGKTAKEAELEGALFNSVHECAQLRKDHQVCAASEHIEMHLAAQ